MGSTRALLLAGVVALGAVTAARAADLPLPPPPPEYVPPEPVFSGWYLRGDVGAGISTGPGIRSTFETTVNSPAFDQQHLEDVAAIGIGVGYQVNNWLRFDATGEYRTPAHLGAIQSYDATGLLDNYGNVIASGRGYDAYSGTIDSAVFLANAYIDLGTWYGVTPYIGAGIGGAYNQIHNLTDHGIGGAGAIGYGGFGTAASRNQWDFAYAAMAGLTYSLTPNLKLDMNYRYLNMGEPVSAPITCLAGCSNERQKYRLESQDIRIGLRWMFADTPPYIPPPLPQPPIIRKD